jgi:hypothetical protein
MTTQRRTTVTIQTAIAPQTIRAARRGALCVHRTVPREVRGWSVTHVPSGTCLVTQLPDATDADHVCAELLTWPGVDWTQVDPLTDAAMTVALRTYVQSLPNWITQCVPMRDVSYDLPVCYGPAAGTIIWYRSGDVVLGGYTPAGRVIAQDENTLTVEDGRVVPVSDVVSVAQVDASGQCLGGWLTRSLGLDGCRTHRLADLSYVDQERLRQLCDFPQPLWEALVSGKWPSWVWEAFVYGKW